ncbi:hypothetical protein A2716_02750 [candidate division WWE3 bacterium RIFCSPHIGHO2_01_FULL_40_23]|uniref:RNase H type-1 domain-containing protein n=1 Tax=candidate division WWE3 bacterium RIFCSPLOWO2_01_FULL_41_18 TaxID=1802625 RepID=A0A1F4VFE7_UNCKA|nr:MAG: hypothetical protein A2716_02750 [candidate division WWE3 bacterium RIFCSPHIGHO2_01_FULL_40_23]OGC55904.1 MAG: hypothetical protein A3A78_02600 [candidate division WWE3 bacterium RIFCSPLOWO2_01_FULL_41_18]
MIFLNTDGGARGNPGPAALAFVISDDKNKVLKKGGEFIGNATNNVSEYKALVRGLSEVLDLGIKAVKCRLDSELVVKQLNGEYRVKDTHLKDLFSHVKLLCEKFDFIEFMHVQRNENKEADRIVNEVLDSKA